MTSKERKEARHQRRKIKRANNKIQLNSSLGSLDELASFHTLYKWGKNCCNNIRWKSSCQKFELRLFSLTAKLRRIILSNSWRYSEPYSFTISERGKTRKIDAPRQIDKQIQKFLTKEILTPLYSPSMIYDNGASQKRKGLDFTFRQLRKKLVKHYKKYGREGWVITVDFHSFFPSANRNHILERHNKLILDDQIRKIADDLINSIQGDIGMPLGVEPSQIEMVSFPTELDNYIACQLGVKVGHYMDDYSMIIPPTRDPKEILDKFIAKANSLGIQINKDKTHIIPLTKKFKFCKATFYLTETGKIVTRGNRKTLSRYRAKMNKFKLKIISHQLKYEDLWCSVNAVRSYFNKFNDHNRLLKAQRIFYAIYKFPCSRIEYFREKDKQL